MDLGEKKKRLRTDPPGSSVCALPRLLRLEVQFNSKLHRTVNVQKCQGGCGPVSSLHGHQSDAHTSCVNALGLECSVPPPLLANVGMRGGSQYERGPRKLPETGTLFPLHHHDWFKCLSPVFRRQVFVVPYSRLDGPGPASSLEHSIRGPAAEGRHASSLPLAPRVLLQPASWRKPS